MVIQEYWRGIIIEKSDKKVVVPLNKNYKRELPLSKPDDIIFKEGENVYVWRIDGSEFITRQGPPKNWREIYKRIL